MSAVLSPPATLDDLMRVDGKAELIAGRIVRFMPNGYAPARIAFKISLALHTYATSVGRGEVFGDAMGFAMRPPLRNGRQSFSPDTCYYDGPIPANPMRFVDGPPTFAVEVRSETDFTNRAEKEIVAKRADYFEAGTLAVWDVDPIAKTVTSYRRDDPTNGRVFREDDSADAEPALPGWQLAVKALFT